MMKLLHMCIGSCSTPLSIQNRHVLQSVCLEQGHKQHGSPHYLGQLAVRPEGGAPQLHVPGVQVITRTVSGDVGVLTQELHGKQPRQCRHLKPAITA